MFRSLLLLLLSFVMIVPVMAQDKSVALVPEYIPPVFEIVPASLNITRQRDYRQVMGAIDLFDKPNGVYLRTRPAGTFFVSISRYQDDWAEINPGEWIHASALLPAPYSDLGGVLLSDLDNQPQLGLLHESVYLRTTPGTEDYVPNTLIEEYTPVYIYEEQVVNDDTVWVRIGSAAWIRKSSVRMVNPVKRPAEITSRHWVGVDTEEQVIIAYDNDTPVFVSLVSTGLEYSPTNKGIFSTYARFSHRDMSRGDINQPWFYHMEDVPYTFYFNGNQALHGAYWHDQFGTQQSHGCVNMSLTAAYWVYNFLSEGFDITDANAVWPMVWVY